MSFVVSDFTSDVLNLSKSSKALTIVFVTEKSILSLKEKEKLKRANVKLLSEKIN